MRRRNCPEGELRKMPASFLGLAVLVFTMALPAGVLAQERVSVRVNAAERTAPFRPIYAYFGYDEPNYTYAKNGSKLIHELAMLTDVPVNVRTHFLLATGDGTAQLKFGSTNVYSEDAAGRAVYDWTIVDRIFDTYVAAHAKPFVEIGFMPQALSAAPEPYRATWVPGAPNKDYGSGWSYPPRDYEKWGELVYQWARHCAEKYGKAQAESWYWEVWNEPNIFYWHGTQAEYNTLYDYAASAVKRALPNARVGGPATTGPGDAKAAAFLEAFLTHCAEGKNSATGGRGAPLDFISYHAKGSPEAVDGHVRMGIARNLRDVDEGLKIISGYGKFRELPVILSESDPEGCAACSARLYPQNAYRNGPLYASYTAAMMKNILELNARDGVSVAGMLTWAFEFEGQPYFDGLRTLATNGVDKPILNFFRMTGMMRGERVAAVSSGAVPLDTMLERGVREHAGVDVLATRDERGVSLLLWNYQDDDVAGPDAAIDLAVEGLPIEASRVLMTHYRIDGKHSNAFAVWKAMGSPAAPTAEQQRQLEDAGQLQTTGSPEWLWNDSGKVAMSFDLPHQAVSLIRIER